MPIRKASRKYNSDFMSRKCDDELEQLEETLTALYANANNEMLAKFGAWSAGYKKKYQAMVEKLEAGEITEAEFKDWVTRRMIDTKIYKATVDSMTDILVNTDIAAIHFVRLV